MSRIYTRTLRLNLENEEERRAWEYLQNPDASQFRSAKQAIVTAINCYCEHHQNIGRSGSENPEIDTEKLLQEIRKIVREELAEAAQSGNAWSSCAPIVADRAGSSDTFRESDPDDLAAALDFVDSF